MTVEGALEHYQAQVPRLRSEFEQELQELRARATRQGHLFGSTYTTGIFNSAQNQMRKRHSLAARSLKGAIDAGWHPTEAELRQAFVGCFAANDFREDSLSDIKSAIQGATEQLGRNDPELERRFILDLGRVQMQAAKEQVAELAMYLAVVERGRLGEARSHSGHLSEVAKSQGLVGSAIPLERAARAIKAQLEKLTQLEGRSYSESSAEESELRYLLEGIIEGAFGKTSSQLSRFHSACSAGLAIAELSPDEMQQAFRERLGALRSVVRALLEETKLYLPAEEVVSVFPAGDEYGFYRSLSGIVLSAEHGVFIVDPYLDENAFNLYVEKIPGAATVRVLTAKLGANVAHVAKKFATGRSLELRSSGAIHDRIVFVDERVWVAGQSIKDAARSKPTYLVELSGASLGAMQAEYERIWDSAAPVVRS